MNNDCKNIRVEKATAPPEEKKFDIILANINRHILLATMGTMAAVLNKDGYLLISGFYAAEDQLLIDAANSQQLQLQQKRRQKFLIYVWSFFIRQTSQLLIQNQNPALPVTLSPQFELSPD